MLQRTGHETKILLCLQILFLITYIITIFRYDNMHVLNDCLRVFFCFLFFLSQSSLERKVLWPVSGNISVYPMGKRWSGRQRNMGSMYTAQLQCSFMIQFNYVYNKIKLEDLSLFLGLNFRNPEMSLILSLGQTNLNVNELYGIQQFRL